MIEIPGPAELARARRAVGRPARLLAIVAGGGLALVTASGCGPVNAGDTAEAEYQGWVDQVDGVASADVSGLNLLPFHAEVSATVTLDDALSEQEVLDVLTELGTFRFEANASLSTDVVYVVGDTEITMEGDAEPEVWAALATDPALREVVTSVTVSVGPEPSVTVDAVTRGDAIEGSRFLDAAVERHMGVVPAGYAIHDGTRTTTIEGYGTGPAREVYEQVRAQVPITGALVHEGEVVVSIPDLEHDAREALVAQLEAMSTLDVEVIVA